MDEVCQRLETRKTLMKRCWIAVVLTLILVVAAAARLHASGAKCLWLDEVLSWRLQSFPAAEIVARSGETSTVHPPLYFLLLRFWGLAFGDSEFALRSFSAVAGIAATLGIFFLVRDAVRFNAVGSAESAPHSADLAGILASLLVAVNPFQAYLGKQVRGYTLGMLLLVLSSWALLRMLAARSTKTAAAWTAVYVLTALALCYTHALALFSVAAQALFVIAYLWIIPGVRLAPVKRTEFRFTENHADTRQFVRMCALAAALLLFVGYLPWLSNLWGQSESLRTSWTSPLSLHDLALHPSTALLGVPNSRPIEPRAAAWCATALLLAALFASAVTGRWAGIFFLLAGTIPLLLILAYCTFSVRSIFNARYLAFAQLAWLASLALLVSRIPHRPERAIAAAVLVMWSAFGWIEYWDVLGPARKPGMRDAAAYVAQHRQADEIVLAHTPSVFFKLAYYFPGEIPARLCVRVAERQAQPGSAHLHTTDLITLRDALAQRPAGLWIVTSDSYRPQYTYLDILLPPGWRMTESKRFDQDIRWEKPIEVKHYRPENTPAEATPHELAVQ